MFLIRTQVTSFDPTSASVDSHESSTPLNDLSSELPRVLYNERETHPRDLPPEFVSNYPFAQASNHSSSYHLNLPEPNFKVPERKWVISLL